MDVTRIGQFVVGLVKPHVDYIIDHDSNVDQLRDRLNELDHVKSRVLNKVADAESRSQKIEIDVDEWLKRVEGITEKARKLLGAESHAQMCFYGLCPNFITLYNPSKNALALAQLMVVEVEKGNKFRSVAFMAPLQATTTTSKGYQAFASRTSIVTKILEEFKKENINMIGVFGMAGVGKSTFVKQVANQAKEEKLFDNVGEAEVKQNPDVKSIQNKLALSFGLQLDKTQTIDERQLILRNHMKEKKKKILIILDDIWEVLDLKTLGLEEDDCKILLTSRDGVMLHSKMGTQINFPLEVLDKKETWSLFEKKVVDDVKHPDIREVAIKIAKRCGGLPILVNTIAKTLRGKPIYSWNDALMSLNRSDGKELLRKLHSGIEWSYNQLDDEGVKSLFLLSGMLWVQTIHLCDLLKYTMGLSLKLYEGIDTLEKAYDRLQSSVDKLKESCLLLDTDNNQFFKMHDLTRDVARKIASRDQHFLSFAYKSELKEWPNKELLQKCAMMTINRINIPKLPQELECQGLHLFLLNSIDRSLQIPHNFFKKTKQLKVLDLTNLCIPSLPPSIKSLTSLQTLCLDRCELGDITIVGELRNLEFLSFIYSKVKQLPKEIGNLTRLRSLDMRNCPELEVIYPDVIKSLTRLEELKMNNSFNRWETEEASYNINERSNASLSELKHLSNLTTLGINIKDVNQLPINFFSEKLKHFTILIGDVWNWYAKYGISKTLKVKLSQRNQWDQGLERILKRCEDLSLDVFEGVANIVYQLDMDGFQRLKKLHVQNNPEISHIVNSNIGHSWIHSHAAFPILVELSLCNLVNLENLYSGQLAVESFGQLKIIKVQGCPKLKNLFSLSTILHFLQLEEIEVEDCNSMKEIIVGEKDKQSEIEANDPIKFHWLQSLSLQGLPELTCFTSNAKLHETSTSSDPQQLFNDMVVFPKLEKLKLSSIPLGKLWYGNYSARMSWIQNLTSLIVDGCDGLSFLCSSSMALNFVQLKNLEIRRCQNMVKIISTEEALGNLEKMDKMFSKLQTLKLEALGKLQIFCTSPTYIEFPCLQFLDIKDCTALECFISESMRRKNDTDPAGYHLFDENVGFPNLEELCMKGLHKLTTIWPTQLAPDSFYKLTFISVYACPSLIHIIGPSILKRLRSLKKLFVESCESVQDVFNGDHDQSEVFSCQNLLQVNINCCKSLKIVFPAPVVRALVKLETLIIFQCEILELIVGEEYQMVGVPTFVFQRLTILKLRELPQLRSFYPGMHTSMWPSLRKLWLRPSWEHENLAEEYSIFQQQQHEHDQLGTPTKQPILLFQKGSFSHLEEFNLWFRDGLELPLEFLGIKRLYVSFKDTASAVGASVFLKKFHNLQELGLYYGTMEEIFINEGALDGEEQHVFAHLKSLDIHEMDNLIHVWKENSNLAGPVFPNLEILKTEKCGRLKNIVFSAISFRNLVQLEVVECHGLKHLITCSVAKTCVQLQSISVENCQGMIEIVASDDDDSQDIGDANHGNEITFSQLKDLKLSNLPNLKGFCSLNYNVKFSFLTTLSVTSCIEMKISPDGVLLNDSKHDGVASQIAEEEEEDDHNNTDDEDNVHGERFQEGAAE